MKVQILEIPTRQNITVENGAPTDINELKRRFGFVSNNFDNFRI